MVATFRNSIGDALLIEYVKWNDSGNGNNG
jgi:hypothetical protein